MNTLFKIARKFELKYGQTEVSINSALTEKQKSDMAWQRAVSNMPRQLINAVGQPVTNKEEIRKVQQALLNKGQHMEAGADGIWGRQTFSALWGYQYKNKLPTTGTLNQETITALGLL